MQYKDSFTKYPKCRATGKVSFPTKAQANWIILKMHWGNALRRDKVDGHRMKHRAGKSAQRRAYYCGMCKGYHLTRWTKGSYNRYIQKTERW